MRARFPSLFTALVFTLIASPLLNAQSAAGKSWDPSSPYGAAFSIEDRGAYRLVTVRRPWSGAAKSFSYVLYRRGQRRPAGVKADAFIETPVRRVVTFSTTYLPQIDLAGGAESVVGVDMASVVCTPSIRARIDAGKTVEVARNGVPDIERILSLKPDLVITYGMGNEWDSHPKLIEAGLPVVIDAEWNENDPLARAAWAIFIAAFYDNEETAASRIAAARAEYLRIKAMAAAAPERPRVLVNGPFQGTWYISGGASYMARFIADAGGSYLWADDANTGSLALSVEAAFERGRLADVWLNPNFGAVKLSDVLSADPRFAMLPVAVSGSIWNNNLRMSAQGGNDYFESSVLNPDKVLADLVKIFHPSLLADRSFVYYRKLER